MSVPGTPSLLPTRKWFAALISGVSAVAVSAVESGNFGQTEQAGLKVLALSLIVAYFKSNLGTPGGVALKK